MGKPKEEPFNLQDIKDKVKNDQKQNKQNEKETTNMNKKHIIETIKTILITVLITGIVAFYYGFISGQENKSGIVSEAKSLITAATVTAEPKK